MNDSGVGRNTDLNESGFIEGWPRHAGRQAWLSVEHGSGIRATKLGTHGRSRSASGWRRHRFWSSHEGFEDGRPWRSQISWNAFGHMGQYGQYTRDLVWGFSE